jgi:hypothetical protein
MPSKFSRDSDDSKASAADLAEWKARDWLTGAAGAHGCARYYGWVGRLDPAYAAAQVKGKILRCMDAVAEDMLTAIRLTRELEAIGWRQVPEARIDWDRAWKLILADVEQHGPTSRAEICERTGLPWVVTLTTVRALQDAGHTCIHNWRGASGNPFAEAARRAGPKARGGPAPDRRTASAGDREPGADEEAA